MLRNVEKLYLPGEDGMAVGLLTIQTFLNELGRGRSTSPQNVYPIFDTLRGYRRVFSTQHELPMAELARGSPLAASRR